LRGTRAIEIEHAETGNGDWPAAVADYLAGHVGGQRRRSSSRRGLSVMVHLQAERVRRRAAEGAGLRVRPRRRLWRASHRRAVPRSRHAARALLIRRQQLLPVQRRRHLRFRRHRHRFLHGPKYVVLLDMSRSDYR
jgi:hypothetical protein